MSTGNDHTANHLTPSNMLNDDLSKRSIPGYVHDPGHVHEISEIHLNEADCSQEESKLDVAQAHTQSMKKEIEEKEISFEEGHPPRHTVFVKSENVIKVDNELIDYIKKEENHDTSIDFWESKVIKEEIDLNETVVKVESQEILGNTFSDDVSTNNITEYSCCQKLEKFEHVEHHAPYCLEDNSRICNFPAVSEQIKKTAAMLVEGKVEGSLSNSDKFFHNLHADVNGVETKKLKSWQYKQNHKINVGNRLNAQNDCVEYTCDNFIMKFNDEANLIKHTEKTDKAYKCQQCSFQAQYKSCLQNHLYTHMSVKPFQCEFCQTGFARKDHLKMHINFKHTEGYKKEYKCTECSYETHNKAILKIHLQKHSDLQSFSCHICPMKFKYKRNLVFHIKAQHSEKFAEVHKCQHCSFETKYKSSLRVHTNSVHTPIEEFRCEICKKNFTMKSGLKKHISNKHTIVKQYKCTECSYETNNKYYLQRHLYTHSDIRPFKCGICQIEFKQKLSLDLHMKDKHTENDTKDYRCLHCTYETNYKPNLLSHVRMRHAENTAKAFRCAHCSYETNFKYTLQKHLNTHKHAKPFKCEICFKGYRQKRYLSRHTKEHH